MPYFKEPNEFSQNFNKKSPLPLKKFSETKLGKGFGKLKQKWEKWKETKISKGLSAAGEKLQNIQVDKPTVQTTQATKQSDVAPDVTTLAASSDNPIKPITKEEKSSVLTKKRKKIKKY